VSVASGAAQTDAVIVFKASSANSPVPSDCTNAIASAARGINTLTVNCNIYRAADLAALDEGHFGWSELTPLDNANKWDAGWPATKRNEEISGSVDPDWVGVYVQVNHKSISGIVPTRKLRNTSIVQIEPQRAA
jgi:hypothetical protein